MPNRFDSYRMKDGHTPLSERYFNPVFGDIDLRIADLEQLKVSWEEAVRKVSALGLTRINEVLRPALDQVDQKVAEAETLLADVETERKAALAQIAVLEEHVTALELDVDKSIEAATTAVAQYQGAAEANVAVWKAEKQVELNDWKTARLAELETWRADLAGALPALNDRLNALEIHQGEQDTDAASAISRIGTLEALVYAAL